MSKLALALRTGDCLYNTFLEKGQTITFGGKKDDVVVSDFEPKQISVKWKDNDELLVDARKRYGYYGAGAVNGLTPLTGDADPLLCISEYAEKSDQTIKLPYTCRLTFGRSKSSDVQINLGFVSSRHFELTCEAGHTRVKDLNSTNGLFLNGKRIDKAELRPGDVLSLMTVRIQYVKGELLFENVGDRLRIGRIEQGIKVFDQNNGRNFLYSRSPRIREALPSEEIVLSPPPTKPQKVGGFFGSMFSSLIGSGAMMASSIAMGATSPALLAARAAYMVSPISTVFINSSDRKKKKKSVEEYEAERYEKYGKYIDGQKAKILAVAEQQRNIRLRENPSPLECAAILANLRTNLWERRSMDNDFMDLRIGDGYEKLCVPVKSFENPANFTMESDEVKELGQYIIEETRIVDNVPARLNLIKYKTAGIIGDRKAVIRLVKNLLTELTTSHFYEDVKIVGLFEEKEYDEWKALRWLPHVWDESGQMRYLAFSPRDRANLCDNLAEILHDRIVAAAKDEHGKLRATPHYLFIIGSNRCLVNQKLKDDLLSNVEGAGVSVLFLYDHQAALPHDCQYIVDMDNSGCPSAYPCENINEKILFTPNDSLSEEDFTLFARNMSAVTLKDQQNKAQLPNNISFFEGYGTNTVEELDAASRWNRNRYSKSLRAPLGVLESGKIFDFDLVSHGPHGLVAGTTGSGKSELLQAWILSVALNYHPHDVNFVIIDFKGDSFAGQVAGLPHVVGTITNIGTSGGKKADIGRSINRAIQSLDHEIHRREDLFAEIKVNKFEEYQRAFQMGVTDTPLPRLVIVADEFAQFKKNEPELMKKLINVAVVGRALGIHLVLATQEPGGVVDDQIRSNTNFRICLKVNSTGTSKDVIGTPLAARLSNPGRAYVRIGNDEIMELVQSYYSGARYTTDIRERKDEENETVLVELNGIRRSFAVKKARKDDSAETEIRVISRYLNATAEELGIRKLPSPWYDDLPEELYLDELGESGFDGSGWNKRSFNWLQIPIGRFDIPKAQLQSVQYMDLDSNGHYAIYGAPSAGKTYLLKTVGVSMCRNYRPDEVSLYILDFGNWDMDVLRSFPHVGDVILDGEDEKFNKFCAMINEEMERRKGIFYQNMVNSLKGYRISVGEDLPAIVILIDNMSTMLDIYNDEAKYAFFAQLAGKGASYGIYMVFTAGSPSSVKLKISQSIKAAIALELTDKNDYNMCVGKMGDMSLPTIPGRGYVRNAPPVEFQAAIYERGKDEIQRNTAVKELGASMGAVWKGRLPARIPVMPAAVDRAMLAGAYTRRMEPVFGVAYDTTLPAGLDLSEKYCALVSGSSGSGKSAFLGQQIELVKNRFPSSRIYILDSERRSLDRYAGIAEAYAPASDHQAMEALAGAMVKELDPRLTLSLKRKAEGSFDPQTFADGMDLIFLVIDDMYNLFRLHSLYQESLDPPPSGDDKFWKILQNVTSKAKNLGVLVLAAGRYSELMQIASVEPVTINLLSGQKGIALSDSASLYTTFFACDLPYSEKEKPFGPGNGMLFDGGKCRKIKLAERG